MELKKLLKRLGFGSRTGFEIHTVSGWQTPEAFHGIRETRAGDLHELTARFVPPTGLRRPHLFPDTDNATVIKDMIEKTYPGSSPQIVPATHTWTDRTLERLLRPLDKFK